MSFHQKAIVLTGAASALGNAIAKQLSKLGTKLVVVDRNAQALIQLQEELAEYNQHTFYIANNFQSDDASQQVVEQSIAHLGNMDILINIASELSLNHFSEQKPAYIAQQTYANAIMPMMMCQAVMPILLAQQKGQVINIGSLYAALALNNSAVSTANTHALLGFTQALNREYAQYPAIKASFIGVRPIKTALLETFEYQKTVEKKLVIDNPIQAANQVIDAIHHARSVHFVGQNERYLIWLNQFVPKIAQYFIKKYYL